MSLPSWVLVLALLASVLLVPSPQQVEEDRAPEMVEEVAPEEPVEGEAPEAEPTAEPISPAAEPTPAPRPEPVVEVPTTVPTPTRAPEPISTPTTVAIGCLRSYLSASPTTIQPQTGMSSRVQLDASGFAPGSLTTLSVYGPSIFPSATGRVESNCQTEFTLLVPPDARGGSYRPVVSGTGYDGRPLEVTTEIIVVLGRPSDRDLRASVLFVDTSRGRANPTVRWQVCNLATGWQASYVTVTFAFYDARGERYGGYSPSATVNNVPPGSNNCRSVTSPFHASFEWQRIEIDTVQITWEQE